MIPQHELNLDLPPEKRWTFLRYYKRQVKELEQQVMSELIGQSTFLSVGEKVLTTTTKYVLSNFAAYKEDLKAIAEVLEVNVGRLLLMQLVYEACSCCTSFCFVDDQGKLRHFRTMDWDLPLLKKMTLNLIVTRRGELLYRSVTWAGYLGCLTIMRPGAYTLAVNYRRTPYGETTRGGTGGRGQNEETTSWMSSLWGSTPGKAESRSFWKNFKNLVSYYWPVGYVVKYVAETYSQIEDARRYLHRALLISPTYFTLCGVDRAYVITRNCEGISWPNQTLIVTGTEAKGKTTPQYLIQTNIDYREPERCDNILWSTERIEYLEELKDHVVGQPWLKNEFWKAVSYHPVLNMETIYGGIFCPADDYWEIRLVEDNGQYGSGQVAESSLGRIIHPKLSPNRTSAFRPIPENQIVSEGNNTDNNENNKEKVHHRAHSHPLQDRQDIQENLGDYEVEEELARIEEYRLAELKRRQTSNEF